MKKSLPFMEMNIYAKTSKDPCIPMTPFPEYTNTYKNTSSEFYIPTLWNTPNTSIYTNNTLRPIKFIGFCRSYVCLFSYPSSRLISLHTKSLVVTSQFTQFSLLKTTLKFSLKLSYEFWSQPPLTFLCSE